MSKNFFNFHHFFQRIVSCLICLLLCGSTLAQQSYAISTRSSNITSDNTIQMAEILGVKLQLDRIRELEDGNAIGSEQEMLALKSQVLQKILVGFLEVRRASDKNWRELSYSFNVMRREQRKQDLINEFFTLANFAQLSALYTTEPYLRLNSYFKASAICTQTGGGLGLTLPILSILQQKTARVKKTAPPEVMHDFVDGGPVDASGLPEYMDKFFDATAPGSAKSRREEMFALWKKRYGVDASKNENLCSLYDGEHKSKKTIGTLHTRILLLYSLRTYILEMDKSLLALLRQVKSSSPNQPDLQAGDSNLASLGLTAFAIDAAKLLNIQSQVAQLVSLNKSGSNLANDSYTRQQLEVSVLENVLTGAIEVRTAVDQVDAEINYAADVVLSELLSRRGRQLQLNYEANFIQAGTFGSLAGLLYLNGYTKAGNEMFVISGGIGTCLSTLALRLMRGGSRPIDTNRNSLADVFGLGQQGEYCFSPLIATFLNSPSPDFKNGKTRREQLVQYWQEHKVTTVKLSDKTNLNNLAAMPPAQADTIKIVSNRITMLRRLLARIESLDPELLELLYATEYKNSSATQETLADNTNLTPAAAEAANLVGVQSVVNHLHSTSGALASLDPTILNQRLLLVRKVFTTALNVRTTIDTLDDEISYETDVLGRMTRSRDTTIAVTNNLNFYQLNILAIIIDGILGLQSSPHAIKASNVLNIVSGLAVGGLAGLTVLEQRGGSRPLPAYPNLLGPCLGMTPPTSTNEYHFSPEVWEFINAVPPQSKNGRTRLEQMREVWKQLKNIYPNMNKQSTREKMAACGPAHTNHSETIKLVKNRLYMLYDVQGLVGLFNNGLDELLREVDPKFRDAS